MEISAFLSSSSALFIATLILLVAYWYLSFPKNIPPGPKGLPLLGFLPFFGKRPQLTLIKLGQKYGPVFSLYLGNKLVVVLNSYQAINEAFVKNAENFSGRPPDINFAGQNDELNLIMHDGVFWREHRRFALSLMRDLGVGKSALEPKIMEEIHIFCNYVKKFDGKPINVTDIVSASIANNICLLILGKRFEYDDKWLKFLLYYLKDITETASNVSVLNVLPFLSRFSRVRKMQGTLDKDILQMAEKSKAVHDGSKDNYIDAFIEEVKSRSQKNDNIFSDDAMAQNARILYTAGTGTSSSTILWLTLYMQNYPEVQKKVQEEIDRVIGRDRSPCCADRIRTPYTDAVIHEVMRMTTVVPLGVPHRNKESCNILGQNIPKNTFIIANLWAVHNDPDIWKDPENFRPERFLSAKGEMVKNEHFIPFSTGKRECAGISLAKMELYLYFATMMQHFTLKSDGIPPKIEAKLGIVYDPVEFDTCFVSRDF